METVPNLENQQLSRLDRISEACNKVCEDLDGYLNEIGECVEFSKR